MFQIRVVSKFEYIGVVVKFGVLGWFSQQPPTKHMASKSWLSGFDFGEFVASKIEYLSKEEAALAAEANAGQYDRPWDLWKRRAQR